VRGDHEVETAKAFNRDDLALADGLGGGGEGLVAAISCAILV
jgi:hypothetical protein